MSQKTTSDADGSTDSDANDEYEMAREEMMTTKGIERSSLDHDPDDHALSGMDSKRQAPVEAVAKNVVERYDEIAAYLREFTANAHTATIQRGKHMLREAGIDDVDYDNVQAVLDRAEEEFGYEPVITVKRNKNPNASWSLKVEDNGIGIASETAYAIRDIGLSGWHDDGTTNGQFGQGTMSGFLPVDHYGEFDMTTWSAITGENYRARWKLTDLDKLDGQRDAVGTTFTWPYLIDEAQAVDYYEKTREYAEGMVVPVIYEEYGEDGTQNGNRSDEFTPSPIEDRYAEDSPTVVYEDQYVKAVWSPDDPEGWNTNVMTYCGYQPIDRNDSGYGINSYNMPSAFDVRIKVEDGRVIWVPADSDQSVAGKVPVSRNRYERLSDDEQEQHVVQANVPEGAVVAPEPTDDRDRFESKHVSDTMRFVSARLEKLFKAHVGRIIDDLDGIEDLTDMVAHDRALLFEGIDQYVSVYKKNDADRLQEDIRDVFGIDPGPTLAMNIGVVAKQFGGDVPTKFAEAVGRMQNDFDDEDEFADTMDKVTDVVSHAPRGRSGVSRKKNRSNISVWKLDNKVEDDGTVLMAKTVNQSKANLAWELHDNNQVVQVDEYETWEDTFGWRKLKELPTRNFEKHFPNHDFDESFLERNDRSYGDDDDTASNSDQTAGMSYDDQRAMQRTIKVRKGSGRNKISKYNGERLFERLDEGKSFSVNYSDYDTLIVYDQTEGHGLHAGSNLAGSTRGVAYAVVPSYVADYLLKAENAVTESEYRDRVESQWIPFDWTDNQYRKGAEASDVDERDVVAVVKSNGQTMQMLDEYDVTDDLIDTIEDELSTIGRTDTVRSVTFMSSSEVDDCYDVLASQHKRLLSDQERPSIVKLGTSPGHAYSTDCSISAKSIIYDTIIPDIDRSAHEWSVFSCDPMDDEFVDTMKRLQDAGGFCSTDDSVEPPEFIDDIDWGGNGGKYNDRITTDDYYLAKTMERIEEAGGVASAVQDDQGDDQ